jgi:DNA-directed RNA polymerase subunit RPC12/RpoP
MYVLERSDMFNAQLSNDLIMHRMNKVEERLARLEEHIRHIRCEKCGEPSKPTDDLLTGPCQICGRPKEDGHNWLECGRNIVADKKPIHSRKCTNCGKEWQDNDGKSACPRCAFRNARCDDKPSEFISLNAQEVKNVLYYYEAGRYSDFCDEANELLKQALKGQE